MADGSISRLTENEWPTTLSWLPDSQALAYSQLNEVFLAKLDNPETHDLLMTYSGYISRLTWSPDGYQLAAVHGTPGDSPESPGPTQFDLFSLNTGEVKTILENTTLGAKVWWSPTSQYLVITRAFAFSLQASGKGLSVVNTSTYEVTELVLRDDTSSFEWSPDGQQLAFMRQNVLSIWDSNTLSSKELTNMNVISNPTWSPDGSLIAVSFVEDDRSGILIIDPIDSSQRVLNLAMRANIIFWSPDGQWLLFLSAQDDSAGLYLINSEGEEPYLFLETTGRQLPYDIYWLPDDTPTP
jgi:Tol biopolymer transport system component